MKTIYFAIVACFLSVVPRAQVPGTVKSATRISAVPGSLGVSPNWKLVGQAATSFSDLDGDGIRELAFTAVDVPNQVRGIFLYRINSTGGLKAGNPTILSKGTPPLSTLTTKYPGLTDAENIGLSLTTLHDLNGNGIDEIVASDFQLSRLYVLFMNAAGTADSVVLIQNGLDNFFLSSSDGGLGLGISNVGDIDGDGIEDIATYVSTVNNYGAIYVILMKANGRIKTWRRLSHNSGGIGALTPNYYFGYPPCGVGDLDGDGTPDIMAGAAPQSNGLRGELWTLFMKPDGTVKSYTIVKPNTPAFPDTLSVETGFASALGNIGDLDGDTVVDVAVGAPGLKDSLGKLYGRTYVFFMKRDGTPKARQIIDRYYGNLTLPIDTLSFFGYWLFGAGDFNKDGIPDVGVGAPNATEIGGTPPTIPFNGTGAIYMLALNGVAPVQTGVGDLLQNLSNSYFLYPNPASDRIVIRSRKPAAGTLHVRLLDATGRVVQAETVDARATLELPIQSLPVGTYMIVLEDGIRIQYGKFIKN